MKNEDLFQKASSSEPLAARMRPRTLEEFVGQDHIVGPGRLLRRAIQADQLSSLIFYGPPGTGKTTLARVIANTTSSEFVTINAVLAGVKEIRQATSEAEQRRVYHERRTILFVDEVHRWNKAQQDALLPWVENGTIILIGATTENPYFEVNRALVSRSRIFQLKPLLEADLYRIAEMTLQDRERGYGALNLNIDQEALDHLVNVAGGDARTLLNAIELSVETTPSRFPPPEGEEIQVTLEIAEESIQRRVVLYDKEGDYHFDTISAFIKSIRGSDPDAALYWLAKMVYAGENPRFIFRRMLILASEDIGLANPEALVVTQAASAAFEQVGMPEGNFHLAQAVLYLATSPKSNSTMAFFDALNLVENSRGEVPNHLKDSSRDKEGFGHGEGYRYPHAYRDHWVAQAYLPDSLQGKIFYQPSDQGYEAGIRETIRRRREAQFAAMLEAEERPPEVLSFSSLNRARDLWLERTAGQSGEQLAAIRDRLLEPLALARHHLVLDLSAGSGLLTWEVLRRVPEGGVWSLLPEQAGRVEGFRSQAEALPELERPHIVTGELAQLPRLFEQQELRFDALVGYNALIREEDKATALDVIKNLTRPGGKLSLAEAVPALGMRLSQAVADQTAGGPTSADRSLTEKVRQVEEAIYRNRDNPLVNWDHDDLVRACASAGFEIKGSSLEKIGTSRLVRQIDLERWFSTQNSSGYGHQLAAALNTEELARFVALCRKLEGRVVSWHQMILFITAVSH